VTKTSPSLRRWLARPGSYTQIAAAAAFGELPQLPVKLFAHVGEVYRRVELAAGSDAVGIEALRTAALVHEEPLQSLHAILTSADLLEFAPTVCAVVGAFGRIWRVRTPHELHDYVAQNFSHLPAILLFEVAHEGHAIPAMREAAAVGGLEAHLELWAKRLATGAQQTAQATPAHPQRPVKHAST
jgi:hypothetical protein